MKKYLLPESGNFYKANLHCHTTLSDGEMTREEVKEIYKKNGKFFVEGEWLYNFMGQINFNDYESLNFFQRVLDKSGVFKALEAKGCHDGDTVSIYDFEFDFVY